MLAGAKYTLTTESELGKDIAKARLVVAGVRETMRAAAGNVSGPCAGLLPIKLKMSETLARRQTAAYVNSEEADLYLLIYEAGRARVAEGRSPNIAPYTTAKRPRSQKPNSVAIRVTVVFAGSASTSARWARCNCRCRR